MAHFEGLFRESLAELERRRDSDPRIGEALRRYEGRTLHIVVKDDAGYLFSVSSGELTFQIDPHHVPDDMYLEMDLTRAKKLINERTLSLLDLLFIKYRNVKLEDIEFVRTLFQS